jgi:hypothetical protein
LRLTPLYTQLSYVYFLILSVREYISVTEQLKIKKTMEKRKRKSLKKFLSKKMKKRIGKSLKLGMTDESFTISTRITNPAYQYSIDQQWMLKQVKKWKLKNGIN